MAANDVNHDHQRFRHPHNPEHLTHPKYRADIDGLRAIAILSVVGFHAFPGWINGGFIGVDIFFVISGYLISTIIFGNLKRNSFSFVEFYSRRVKRIFPALLIVLFAAFAFGWFVLLADEYKQLGKHIAAGAGFFSNLALWRESGYFDAAAETKPLLHLWSLGIEEQFYIIWPLLLWFAWKRRFNLFLITVVIAAVSFSLNIWNINSDAVAAFYSPQTRFWELSIGSCLAYLTLFKQSTLQNIRLDNGNLQSFLGAALLAAGVLLITKARAYPGWWALLPTVGTAAIISAGSHAWLNRAVLSNRLLVWFGLISFPLYLWHWPLLSFLRIIVGEDPTRRQNLVAVIVAILLAWLTYRFIETPIRLRRNGGFAPIVLLALIGVVGLTGFVSYRQDGLTFRRATTLEVLNDGDIGHELFHQYPYGRFKLCTPLEIRKEALIWDGSIRCFQSANGQIDIAIIGDSHAENLFIGLAEVLNRKNVVYYVKGSLPFIDNTEFDRIFKYVIDDANITTVIISAYWYRRLTEVPFDSSLMSELQKTLDALGRHKTIYITDDTPNFSFSPKHCKYAATYVRKHYCNEDSIFYRTQHSAYIDTLEALERNNPNVRVLRTLQYFCDDKFCSMAKNGQLLFRDADHLNINGSRFLARRIVADNPKIAE